MILGFNCYGQDYENEDEDGEYEEGKRIGHRF